ncbi:MAG TPA: hypothetical protein DEA22_04490 [Blastocatellia bacterium]|nr:hypothetical protein [Blastocatellia bacterium]
MLAKKKKKASPRIFESIRKPTAPPTRKIGLDKPEEKIHPARRKVKHKKKNLTEDNNGTI